MIGAFVERTTFNASAAHAALGSVALDGPARGRRLVRGGGAPASKTKKKSFPPLFSFQIS